MADDQTGLSALSKATGLTRGLPSWKEGLAKVIESIIDATAGTVLPINDSKASGVGELASAGFPLAKAIALIAGATKATKGIKAYHGSPHDFDQFSLDKIGTGEGAQAYGHGLYFAEAEDVAKSYRDQLSDGRKAYDGKPITKNGNAWNDDADPIETAKFALAWFKGDKTKAEASLLARAKPYEGGVNQRHADWYKTAAKSLDGLDPSKAGESAGRMYEVNINADPDDFLDWDAPLSQQSEKVRGALKSRGLLKDYPAGERFEHPITGRTVDTEVRASDAYNMLRDGGATKPGLPPSSISTQLKEGGIPGIKYLDGASRSKGEGSRNYVVFDDKLISIVKKYGIAGALSAGLINQAQAEQMKQQGLPQ